MRNPSPRVGHWLQSAFAVVLLGGGSLGLARGADFTLDTFARQQLTDVYYSEGIGVGDLNRDGQMDVVYGPYWFAGPSFREKREIYTPKPQNKEGYADHFFAWVHDVNGDGWNDVVTAGFPGTPAFVYENPGAEGHGKHWPKHTVLNHVGNESPQFTNLVGDSRPELVCSNNGYFGYASIDVSQPIKNFTFHSISEKVAPIPFGHGLGVGDVNKDGRLDLLIKDGWFEQPETLDDAKTWPFHPAKFAPAGGADMYAYDVDGDGDNDVITSLAAHDFGLAWHEQLRDGDKITFRQHLIMGNRPAQNRYGLVFSEPHAVNLADIDGDGLKDIVTGKTYYSHHKQAPMWDAGAVVYWFKLKRTPDGVDWVPYKADGEAGIGRQLFVGDINGDGLPDIASGGMKGAHVLLHRRETVDKKRWEEAQPKVRTDVETPGARGPQAAINAEGRVVGAIEGEGMTVLNVVPGKVGVQKMDGFKPAVWSGNEQLYWTDGKPGDRLELEFQAPRSGKFAIVAAFTLARDYAIVQPAIDGKPAGGPLNLFHSPDVVNSGEIPLATQELSVGKHRLSLEITGANPSAVPSFMVGLDYVRVAPR